MRTVTVGDQCLINYATKIAECMIHIATSLSRTVPLLLGLVRTGKMVNPSLKDSGSHLLNNSNDDIEDRWFSTEYALVILKRQQYSHDFHFCILFRKANFYSSML
jgi:hypothetical protein